MAEKTNFYQWNGVNKSGRKMSGYMENDSINKVKAKLASQGLQNISVKKVSRNKKEGGGLFGGKKIKSADVAVFSRQLATMLKNGIPLINSLSIVKNGLQNPKMKEVVANIEEDVAGGTPFNQALKKYPEQFDDLYVNLVAVGEDSGSLDNILHSMANYLEKSESIKKKIKKALSYPIGVIVISFIVTLILMIKVVPSFENMFESFGGELPAPTRAVIAMSEFTQNYYMYMIIGIIASIFIIKRVLKTNKKLKRKIEYKITGAPIFGNIIVKSSIARFARTLSTTFSSGIPMVQGLTSAAPACGNAKYIDAVFTIRDDVESGVGLGFSMEESGVFPDVIVQMVSIGEETGALDSMLDKSAEYFEDEVDAAVDSLTSMIEPLIMSILGILIGGIIIAMYLPIFEMGKNI